VGCAFYIGQPERFSSQGHEHMVIQGSIGAPVPEIQFQSSLCRFMQRHKATLVEFGVSMRIPGHGDGDSKIIVMAIPG
jgi:hypothetical protein